MDLYEYQARELFEAHAVPVPPGEVATTPAGAEMAAVRIGGPVVVKAQVMTGGRGKAGGVRLASSPVEAREHAEAILGMDIKGHRVHRVLVSAASEIVEEYYVSFLLDRGRRSFLAMASAEGGVEIEELARERPEALVRLPVDDATGCDAATARHLVTAAGLPPAVLDAAVDVVTALWATAVAEDATLVEVNPLARVAGDRVLALDGKVTLDDNADFRRPPRPEWAEAAETDSREAAARARDLNYVKLEGEVGVIGNGAGLVMSTLDVVAAAGQRHGGWRPANFLDIGGGASAAVMTDGLDIVLGDPDVRSVLVNVFGGITACDQVAAGIVAALEQLGEAATKPLVVRLDGNNVEAGRAILADAAHPLVTVVGDMDLAADAAAALAGTGARS